MITILLYLSGGVILYGSWIFWSFVFKFGNPLSRLARHRYQHHKDITQRQLHYITMGVSIDEAFKHAQADFLEESKRNLLSYREAMKSMDLLNS